MSWRNKTIWWEGMFLRPQHFQQHERYIERLIEARAWPISPYPWGFTTCAIDENALRQGHFALTSASGILLDGTPFNFPGDDSPPESLEIPKDTRNELVYLAVPEKREETKESDLEGVDGTLTRFHAEVVPVSDSNSKDARRADVEIGRMRLQLQLHRDNRTGFSCVPVGRISERSPDGQIQLSPTFIPPALSVKDNAGLSSYLRELRGLLRQRGDTLAKRASQPGRGGTAELVQFLWLMAINRFEPVISHMLQVPALHPERAYEVLVSLAGELCSFAREARRAADYPAYRHDDLEECFGPVMDDLRRTFRMVIDELAIPIPLETDKDGVRVGRIPDVSLTRNGRFVLATQAQVKLENLRNLFPSRVKIGPSETIWNLVQGRIPGIAIHPMANAPREIAYHANTVYFELERDPTRRQGFWEQLEKSGGIGIYVEGDFPGLQLELWAIRA